MPINMDWLKFSRLVLHRFVMYVHTLRKFSNKCNFFGFLAAMIDKSFISIPPPPVIWPASVSRPILLRHHLRVEVVRTPCYNAHTCQVKCQCYNDPIVVCMDTLFMPYLAEDSNRNSHGGDWSTRDSRGELYLILSRKTVHDVEMRKMTKWGKIVRQVDECSLILRADTKE